MAAVPRCFASSRFAQPRRRVRLAVEYLEARLVLSSSHGPFHALMVAGDPNGNPADSPSQRVDANTTTSPFAGVGSVQVNAKRGTYIGTGTPISSYHILTAAHVVDINNDGKVTSRDGLKSVYFILNFGGNQTHKLLISKIDVHPDYTGFSKPSVNDDVAVLTLATPLPTGVPVYALPTGDLTAGTTITMVGYGRSGDGVNGYTTNASFTVKRSGQNSADAFTTQDDKARAAANEVFRFDFDGPAGTGTFGGATLGNAVETTLGGGDSGGPSFVRTADGQQVLVGVNTFSQGTAPYFGSLGGGINVYAYLGFINGVLSGGTVSAAGGTTTTTAGKLKGDALAVLALLDADLSEELNVALPTPTAGRVVLPATVAVSITAPAFAAPAAPTEAQRPATVIHTGSLGENVIAEEPAEAPRAEIQPAAPARPQLPPLPGAEENAPAAPAEGQRTDDTPQRLPLWEAFFEAERETAEATDVGSTSAELVPLPALTSLAEILAPAMLVGYFSRPCVAAEERGRRQPAVCR